jgi:hypothetical protein
MSKTSKSVTAQLGLFPTSPQIQQLPREIDQKTVALLARLPRQHADQRTVAASRPEAGRE